MMVTLVTSEQGYSLAVALLEVQPGAEATAEKCREWFEAALSSGGTSLALDSWQIDKAGLAKLLSEQLAEPIQQDSYRQVIVFLGASEKPAPEGIRPEWEGRTMAATTLGTGELEMISAKHGDG